MYCLNCGAGLPEGARFCQECGKETARQPETIRPPLGKAEKKLRWPIAVTVIGVIIIMVLLIVVLLSYAQSDGGGGVPWVQTYSGTVELTLFNDDWTGTRSYSVYADGDYEVSGTLDALTTAHRTFQVSWTGGSQHQCTIVLYSDGARNTQTTWLTDGMTASMAMTI